MGVYEVQSSSDMHAVDFHQRGAILMKPSHGDRCLTNFSHLTFCLIILVTHVDPMLHN